MKPFVGTIPLGECRTRDGRKARVLCNDASIGAVKLPVIAIITQPDGQQYTASYYENGTYSQPSGSPSDLFPLPEVKTFYANVRAATGDSTTSCIGFETACREELDTMFMRSRKAVLVITYEDDEPVAVRLEKP